jgi:CHAD domain-containing protein
MTETTRRPPRQVKPGSPAGQAVLAYLREQAAALDRLAPGVRRDEPDAVHQMRVAARRLRSTLRTFRRVIGPAGDLDDELRWLAGVLGEARDAEVLAGHLEAALTTVAKEELIGPVQARIKIHFAPVAAQAREAVLEALDSERYGSLRDRIGELVAGPLPRPRAGRPAGDVLPREVRRAYRAAARRMERARQAAPGTARDTALHQARKAAKRARYAGELAQPTVGQQAKRFTRQVKAVQTLLGDHHDAVIARQQERGLGMEAHLSGENAFTYGLLYERESETADELRARAFKAWKKASRRRYRRWMS